MNRLALIQKIVFTFVFALVGVISWGQRDIEYTIKLTNCAILGVQDYYDYTGSAISVVPSVSYHGETVSSGYTYKFYDESGNEVSSSNIMAEGFYRLVVTGDETILSGEINKDFYVRAEHALSGSGTQANPWIINNEQDWIEFATHTKYWASGKYVKLNTNVNVGAGDGLGTFDKNALMVGTSQNPFKGTFDGGNHILTFYYGNSCNDSIYSVPVAPFQYTDNAKFKNLRVDGEIYIAIYGAAGLIGHNTGTTTVNDVTVRLFIDCYDWDEDAWLWQHRCGGFAVDGSGVKFTKCIYNGVIMTVENDRNGGFCGKGSAKTSFTNCLFNPDRSGYNVLYGVAFANGGGDYSDEHPEATDAGIGTVENSYYTWDSTYQVQFGQGTFAYYDDDDITDGVIAKELTVSNNVSSYNIYEPVDVTIDNDIFLYEGSALPANGFILYFDGEEATEGTEYTSVITNSGGTTVTEFNAVGDYTLTITGENTEGFYGSTSKTLKVIPAASTWSALQSQLTSGASEITLSYDYYARDVEGERTPLVIDRNVTINLNGHTIDRHLLSASTNGQVLRINSGKTVVINGPGTITGGYKKAENESTNPSINDGGGIYNKGNLTLRRVDVVGNKCEKSRTNSTSATARGGGIYSGENSTLIIEGCTIRENSAHGGAGGIFADKITTFIMRDYDTVHSKVKSNKSLDKGGGIRICNTKGDVTLTNCVISSNAVNNSSKESVANGGGIHLDEGSMTLTNCKIERNEATKYGGGIYAIKGSVNANNCNINYNTAYDAGMIFEGRGGGVFMHGGSFNMTGGSIVGNASNISNGGGIYINNGARFYLKAGTATISDNIRIDNGTKKNTNVFLVGSSIITIQGTITGSTIGVEKNNGEGVFTSGLSTDSHGTIACFSSDNSKYTVVGYNGEAKLAVEDPYTPTPGTKIDTINEPVVINSVLTIDTIVIGPNGSVTIVDDGTLNSYVKNNDETKLIINGGQLITTNPDLKATIKKDIIGALAWSSEYWYLISSAISSPNVAEKTNMLKFNGNDYPEYDLYRFNEAVSLQWENYRNLDHIGDFANLQNGRGYLYRNLNDYTISISGTLTAGQVEVPVTNTERVGGQTNLFRGLNIIGNPYSHDIKKGSAGNAIPNGSLLESHYYVLTEEGEWSLSRDNDSIIHPFDGILVQAKSSGTLTISKVPYVASKSREEDAANDYIWFAVCNDVFEDRACIEFKEGHGLNKIEHENEKAPMLYIRHNDEDFASVDMSANVKAAALNFKAMTTGVYTLKVQPVGSYSYLHVYDRLTGEDVDMLGGGEYRFVGSVSDSEDRFVVRLSNNNATGGNDVFAYQSGSDIVVIGDGELEVFDVMGRMVMRRNVNGVQTVNGLNRGVYILRLNEKTQKIVVR